MSKTKLTSVDGRSLPNMEFLTKEEIEDFRKAFNLFDNDGSGTISSRELITSMQNLNLRPSEDEIASIIKVREKFSFFD